MSLDIVCNEKKDSNLLISSNNNQTKAVVWSIAFHASLKIILYCPLLTVHINIPKFYHMQVLALSVDLSRDAEDVENTLEQVSFFSLF